MKQAASAKQRPSDFYAPRRGPQLETAESGRHAPAPSGALAQQDLLFRSLSGAKAAVQTAPEGKFPLPVRAAIILGSCSVFWGGVALVAARLLAR